MSKRLLLLFSLGLTASLFASAKVKTPPKLTIDQARAIALHEESGTVKGGELEREHGRWIYSFDIATPDGLHEVNVDANTGKVVEESKESAADEAKEAAQDNHDKAHRAKNKQNPK